MSTPAVCTVSGVSALLLVAGLVLPAPAGPVLLTFAVLVAVGGVATTALGGFARSIRRRPLGAPRLPRRTG